MEPAFFALFGILNPKFLLQNTLSEKGPLQSLVDGDPKVTVFGRNSQFPNLLQSEEKEDL